MTRLFAGNREVEQRGVVRVDFDFLVPSTGLREDRTLYPLLREDVEAALLSDHFPTFVPGLDFIFAGGNSGYLKLAAFIGDGIVKDAGPP